MGWWILLLIFLLLLLILLILLLTNVVLFIDTRQHRYGVRFGQVVEARLVMKDNHPGMDVRLFWMHFFLDFFTMDGEDKKAKKKKDKRHKQKKGRKPSVRTIFRMIRRVLRSFRIRQCEVDLDTDSGVWNGLLIPFQYLIRNPKVSLRINWEGTNHLVLVIDNSAGRVGWALMMAYVFKR